jgi:hypothetical protein
MVGKVLEELIEGVLYSNKHWYVSGTIKIDGVKHLKLEKVIKYDNFGRPYVDEHSTKLIKVNQEGYKVLM